MKHKTGVIAFLSLLCFACSARAQSINSETVEFQLLKQPQETVDEANRNFKVTVTSPYNLTAADVVTRAKADYQKSLADYGSVVAASEKDYQQRAKDYDGEVAKAKEKYALESTEFKKYSLFERLALTDQHKNPQLVLPGKPEYIKPAPPVYREPNLNDYTIVDNNVLASQIGISGFARGAGYIDINVDIKAVNFQDNAGQTFANQPTKLVIKVNGKEKTNTTFFQDYAFLSSAPSNNINKPLEEKNHLTLVVKFLNDYLNNIYGYQASAKKIRILSVKNKGKYDDLERADIYVKTNLRKLQPENSDLNAVAYTGLQKGVDIWIQTLAKIDYKDNKADFNAKIAQYIYFDLIRLNTALNKRTEAEKYLNQLQENLIYIKLGYDDSNELKSMEKAVYSIK